jgi:hypothetical protein
LSVLKLLPISDDTRAKLHEIALRAPRKAELPAERNVVFDPVIDLNHKLVEIVKGYEARTDKLWDEIWRQAEAKGKPKSYANDRHPGPYDTIGGDPRRDAFLSGDGWPARRTPSPGLFDPLPVESRVLVREEWNNPAGKLVAWDHQRASCKAAYNAIAALNRRT